VFEGMQVRWTYKLVRILREDEDHEIDLRVNGQLS